jgi:hypothetical protein
VFVMVPPFFDTLGQNMTTKIRKDFQEAGLFVFIYGGALAIIYTAGYPTDAPRLPLPDIVRAFLAGVFVGGAIPVYFLARLPYKSWPWLLALRVIIYTVLRMFLRSPTVSVGIYTSFPIALLGALLNAGAVVLWRLWRKRRRAGAADHITVEDVAIASLLFVVCEPVIFSLLANVIQAILNPMEWNYAAGVTSWIGGLLSVRP